MNNKTKALDIAMSLIDCKLPTLEKCRISAIQMAEWKDKQFAEEKEQWIEKACGWLSEAEEDEQSKYIWYDGEEGFCGLTEELVNDFKQAMEEQL